jgi:hypothetical protein
MGALWELSGSSLGALWELSGSSLGARCSCGYVQKYDIELSALLSWPNYSSYEEDVKMRNAKWDKKYLGLQPIMWGMTNILAYLFSDADFQ